MTGRRGGPRLTPRSREASSWRGRRAVQFLFGRGDGPYEEALRLVGSARRDGFHLHYIVSYDRRRGLGRSAVAWLKREFGAVHAREVRSNEGQAFCSAMMEAGLIDSSSYD